MTNHQHEALVEAVAPFLAALDVNESDTLGMLSPDSTELFGMTGSWTGRKAVTLGDLRRLRKAIAALSATAATPSDEVVRFRKGDAVSYPLTADTFVSATVIGDVEGWYQIQFVDESLAIVRPSHLIARAALEPQGKDL